MVLSARVCFCLLIATAATSVPNIAPKARANVLWIVADNLRPALGAYGNTDVLSPRIDALAQGNATVFSRAYCQIAWCAPSRNSFLTGRRPDATQAWNFRDSFRVLDGGDAGPGHDWVTLPGYFKQNGYYTISSGKVFHNNLPPNFDFPHSWSEMPVEQSKFDCANKDGLHNMTCVLPPGVADADELCADEIIDKIKAWRADPNETRPFFAAAGLQSTRLAWSYPAHVASRYPPAAQLAIAKHRQAPADSHSELELEWFRPVEVDFYKDVKGDGVITHDQPMSVAAQQEVRLAYYAAVTNIDDQVGRLVDTLKDMNLFDNTVVVLSADHGQNLGEGNMWSMMNLLETALRVPLIIKPAAATKVVVPVYDHPVELVDVFPTMASLAGLPPPPLHWQLPGSDLTPAMRNGTEVKPTNAAFGQITRCQNCSEAYGTSQLELPGCAADQVDASKFMVPCALTAKEHFDWMGMTMRTRHWRYSTFCRWRGSKLSVDWSSCTAQELYNHTSDTALYDVDDNGEPFHNLAGRPEVEQLQKHLHAQLQAQFSQSQPSPVALV